MKFKPLALGLTSGIFGAVYMLIITYYPVITGMIPAVGMKGSSMRFIMADMYPFYNYGIWYRELAGVVFGFIDCFIAGLLFAYLYNALANKLKK